MIKLSEMKVRCISRPNFELDEFLEFLRDEGLVWNRTKNASAAEELIEISGRVCYMSFGIGLQSPRTNQEYILNLINQGHDSVLEHVSWTFLLTGVSRAFTHQLVRHRVGFSYSQLSQQYHDESDAKYIAPQGLNKESNIYAEWVNHIEAGVRIYKDLSSKEVNQVAEENGLSFKEATRLVRTISRSILPNATETKIVLTANARAIRHFLDKRGLIDGDHEMRAVAAAFYKIVSKDAPALFQDFSLMHLKDGTEKVVRIGY
ncbi:FAD-dependent thymidylate synthase [Neisseriaceae bacterium CLB008]